MLYVSMEKNMKWGIKCVGGTGDIMYSKMAAAGKQQDAKIHETYKALTIAPGFALSVISSLTSTERIKYWRLSNAELTYLEITANGEYLPSPHNANTAFWHLWKRIFNFMHVPSVDEWSLNKTQSNQD